MILIDHFRLEAKLTARFQLNYLFNLKHKPVSCRKSKLKKANLWIAPSSV